MGDGRRKEVDLWHCHMACSVSGKHKVIVLSTVQSFTVQAVGSSSFKCQVGAKVGIAQRKRRQKLEIGDRRAEIAFREHFVFGPASDHRDALDNGPVCCRAHLTVPVLPAPRTWHTSATCSLRPGLHTARL